MSDEPKVPQAGEVWALKYLENLPCDKVVILVVDNYPPLISVENNGSEREF